MRRPTRELEQAVAAAGSPVGGNSMAGMTSAPLTGHSSDSDRIPSDGGSGFTPDSCAPLALRLGAAPACRHLRGCGPFVHPSTLAPAPDAA